MTNCLKSHIAHGATEGCAHRPRMVSVSFSRWKMMCQQWHCWGNFDFIVSAKACSTYAPFHPCHFTGLNDSHNFLTMKLFCNSYIVLMHLIILINMLLFSCNIRFLFIALILFSGCCSVGLLCSMFSIPGQDLDIWKHQGCIAVNLCVSWQHFYHLSSEFNVW